MVENAVYEPPLALEVHVPSDDGGVLLCRPGTGAECQQMLSDECRAIIGPVAVGSSDDVEVGLHNISNYDTLTIHSITLSNDSDPAFELIEPVPTTVGPVGTEVVILRFSPTGVAEHQAVLVVVSDAVNADEGTVSIKIAGDATE